MTDNRSVLSVALVCSLALVQLVVPLICQASNDGEQRLCDASLESHELKLASLQELASTSANECDDYTKGAFNELIELVKLGGVCTMDHASKVTQYSRKYLATEKLASKLPVELVQFALAYGKRMSEICKEHMRVRLLGESIWFWGKPPFQVSCDWTDHNDRLDELMELDNEKTSVSLDQLPSDYAAIFPETVSKHKMPMLMDPDLVRVTEACEKEMGPIYEPLVLPIAHLARNGLNYHQSSFAHHFNKNDRYGQKARQLSKIVLVCESLKQFEMAEQQQPISETSKNDRRRSNGDDDDDEEEEEEEEEVDFPFGCEVDGRPKDSPSDMMVNDCEAASSKTKRQFCLTGHELANKISSSFVDDKFDSALSYVDANGSGIDQFRDELFRNAFSESMKGLKYIAKLIQVASLQVGDGKQNQELDSAKMTLLRAVGSDNKEELMETILRMTKEDKPLARELAIRSQLLVIGLEVALSYEHEDFRYQLV